MAFYSLIAQDLSAPLPRDWDANKIGAIALSADDRKQFNVVVEGGRIKMSIPTQRPVIVYREIKQASKT